MSAGGLFFTERGAFAQALLLTPAQTEGPYYPNRMPLDQDNDLLVINNSITPGMGTVAWLSGRVLSRTGSPIRNAVVEIWQADNVGSYINTNGALNGQRDSNFQGYGKFQTASDGKYLFRTIKPGLYPGRVRHVHAKVSIPGGQSLTTQLYIEGETGNDGVLNGVPAALRPAVVRPWTPVPGSSVNALAVTWDLILDYTPAETPAPSRPTLVAVGGVTNGASFQAGAASGSWVTLYGAGLSTVTRTWGATDFANGKLPESLENVSVRINDRPASIAYVSPTQINVLAPDTTVDATAQVTVTNNSGTSAPVSVPFQRLMPAFFTLFDEHVSAVHADGTLVGPAGFIDSAATTPARPGETVLLYGTGFGPTNPDAASGRILTESAQTVNPVRIQIDTQEAAVAFAGLTSAGLYQFNVTIPSALGDGDYPVTAEINGVRTAKFARIRVQRAG